MHIDTGNEELTQQLPLVEEPEDQEPVNPEQEEYPPAAPDFATEEANPSEEGRQDHILPANFVLWLRICIRYWLEPHCIRPLAALALAPTLGT